MALKLAINNRICLGLKEITARSAAHMSSDTWQAKIATGTDATFTNRWFSQANAMTIDAYFATGAPGQSESTLKWQKVISGIVDRVTIDPDKNLVTLDGRDLSASLLS